LRKVIARCALRKIPLVCPTRWLSLGNAFRYIVRYRDAINVHVRRRIQKRNQEAISFLTALDFEHANAVFNTLNMFMKWTESEHSCMRDAWCQILSTIER
jgi:hypothetical protein